MFHALKLRQRILAGYLVPLLLMVAVAAIVYQQMIRLQVLEAGALDAVQKVALVKEIHKQLAQHQRDMRGYLLSSDRESQEVARKAMGLARQDLQRYATETTDPDQRAALASLQAVVDEVARGTELYRQMVDTGNAAKAIEMFREGNFTHLSARIDALASEIETREQARLAENVRQRDEAVDRLIAITIGATVLALIFAFVVGNLLALRITRALGESVSQITTASNEIAATVDEHERTVTQQVAAVSEVSATVEELGVSARQSANQAESSAAAATQALALTQDGIRAANEAAERTAGMKEKIDLLSRQILGLSEQAGQIGGIAKLVGELASETNMLALNAAVEAARAGEQGKGFAVVASEIRKLAVQSKKSAERADALVAEIQKATNSAVMVTEDGSRSADEVLTSARRVNAAFDEIAGAANNVAENAQQVMLNSKQQAAALNQVTDAMRSLSAGSSQMAAGTEQTKVGIENLKQVALGLKGMV